MPRTSLRRTLILLAVTFALAGVLTPAAASPRWKANASARETSWKPVDLLSLLWDAFRSHASGGALKNGGSWDPNGAPQPKAPTEGTTAEEGGAADPNR